MPSIPVEHGIETEVIAVCGYKENMHRIVCQGREESFRAIEILIRSLTRREITHSILIFVKDTTTGEVWVSGALRNEDDLA